MKSRRKVWKITTKRICDVVGKGQRQVRLDIHSGKCDPDNLESFAKYILSELWRKEK